MPKQTKKDLLMEIGALQTDLDTGKSLIRMKENEITRVSRELDQSKKRHEGTINKLDCTMQQRADLNSRLDKAHHLIHQALMADDKTHVLNEELSVTRSVFSDGEYKRKTFKESREVLLGRALEVLEVDVEDVA